MLFDMQRILASVVLLCAWSTVHSRAADLPVSQPQKSPLIQGWTEQDRQGWHHTSAGTQLTPYDWFIALEDEPLRNSLLEPESSPTRPIRTGFRLDFQRPKERTFQSRRSV